MLKPARLRRVGNFCLRSLTGKIPFSGEIHFPLDTQSELGKKLGFFTAQKISDMEKGRRKISKVVAKKLSKIFEVPIERFL